MGCGRSLRGAWPSGAGWGRPSTAGGVDTSWGLTVPGRYGMLNSAFGLVCHISRLATPTSTNYPPALAGLGGSSFLLDHVVEKAL